VKARRTQDFPPELIDSDEAIDLLINAVLIGNAGLRKLTRRVLSEQERLRRAVDDEGWKAYLKLEEAVNARSDVQMQILVRWALAHGARSRR